MKVHRSPTPTQGKAMTASKQTLVALALIALATITQADEAADISHLQSRWAEVKYQTAKSDQEKAFADLATEAETLRTAHAASAPYLIWEGIIRSTYAGAKGGLGALGEVKKAKALFESAIEIDPNALSGSAYTSLGSLYYQVPGWPIGFGDDDQAEAMLLKGLVQNPDGLDSNFFYADYLLDQKDYAKSLAAFEKALQASARAGRESADVGRRGEIGEKIALIKKKM